jgi:hypothetical protein
MLVFGRVPSPEISDQVGSDQREYWARRHSQSDDDHYRPQEVRMERHELADDEERRIDQHERIKGKLGADVHERIAREAATSSPAEQAEVESVAAGLKHRATAEVVETETELGRARRVTRVSQVVDYAFFVIYGLIGLEIVLDLLGARQASVFKRFLDAVTLPVLGPFHGLMRDPTVGSMQLMLSYVVALVAYVLLHWAVNGFLRLFAQRKASI